MSLSGAGRITTERHRQIEQEGWSKDHDDSYENEELALAAVQYALPARHRPLVRMNGTAIPVDWPWEDSSWKPTPEDRIRELEKAGALIAAEIDRLIRAQEKEEQG